MLSLIIKDFKLVKMKWYMLWVSIISSLFFGVFTHIAQGSTYGSVQYIMQNSIFLSGVIWVFFFMVIAPMSIEEQDKCRYILKSLPLNSWEHIISKYIYAFIVYFLYGVLSKLTGAFVLHLQGNLNYYNMHMEQIVIGFFVYLIFISLYIPLNYAFGIMRMRYVNMIIYIAMILVPNALLNSKNIQSSDIFMRSGEIKNYICENSIGILVCILIMFLLSMKVSHILGRYIRN